MASALLTFCAMKPYLSILALVLGVTLQLAAADTNTTITPAVICETTNSCQTQTVAQAGTTNAAPADVPWAFSSANDDKFKDLSASLNQNSGSGPSLWRSAGATVLVLGLLLGVNYWLKKRGGRLGGVEHSARLRIVERVAIDNRRGVVLIEVDGERIVASVCADRIEPLAVLPSKPGRGEGAA